MSQAAMKAVFIILGALLPLAAFPETSSNNASLRNNAKTLAYLTDDGIETKLVEIGKAYDEQFGVVCNGEIKVKYSADTIFILKPVEFPDGTQHPMDGVWQYRFDFVRCGRSATYNVAIVAQKGGEPRYAPLLPGNTIASPTLQMDAIRIVRLKVAAEAKVKKNRQCDDFVISNTSLVSIPQQSKDGGAGGRWEERWVARYCGADIPTPICFTPNAKGTAMLTQSCAEVP